MRVIQTHILIIFAAIAVIVLLYPDYYPPMGINLKVTREDIRQKAKSIANDLAVDIKEYSPVIKLEQNERLIRHIQKKCGLSSAIHLLRNKVDGYVYSVRWISVDIFGPNGDNEDAGNKRKLLKAFKLSFDTGGNLIAFKRTIADTGNARSVTRAEAAILADKFLRKYSRFYLLQDTVELDSTVQTKRRSFEKKYARQEENALDSRVDYEFIRKFPIKDIGDTLSLRIGLVGDRIVSLESEIALPEKPMNPVDIVAIILMALLYIAFSIALIILWFKRIRSYEIGFTLGIKLGALTAIAVFLQILLRLSYPFNWTYIFEIILAPLFIGLGIFVLWVAAEALIREVWNDKLLTVDLLAGGYGMDSHVGRGILRGMSVGLTAFAFLLGLMAGSDRFFSISYIHSTNNTLDFITSSQPVLYMVFHQFYFAIAVVLFLLLVVPGLLRKWINLPSIFLGITILLFSLVFYDNFEPVGIGFLIMAIVGLLFVVTVYRFDFFTTVIAFFVFQLSMGGFLYVFNGEISGWVFIAGFLITLIFALTSILTRDSLTDYTRLTPRYVKFMNERQRLQRELEIAKEVQMSFLPDKMPTIGELEITARCLPALEVGGDYYDFVQLDDNKLGLVIGDVSGKGTQAAFYMTLTKGFLRAVSRRLDSPKQIMSELNALFFENAPRDTFISMVYALFDMNHRKITIARAGHNPILKISSEKEELEIIKPAGLALGLEKGDTFDEIIEDVTLPLNKDDVYVFYTDGVNEAMDRNGNEFGEERLHRSILQNRYLPVKDMLDRIYKEVYKFAGKKGQRDDMSMIIVRVK